MSVRIPLSDDDWLLKGYIGDEWIWNRAVDPEGGDRRWWYQGRVPGSVHDDLWRAGQIPDPYFERNSLLLEWVPQRTWVYKRSLILGPEHRGKRVRLVFEGVDYEAEFYLNGELLGSHTGMYTPTRFEVGEKLHYGEPNLLAVVIQPAPSEQPQVGRTSRVRTHKSRMTYWWDFCPRMIHVGIWDDAYMELTGRVSIEDVWVRPRLSEDLLTAEIAVATELSVTEAAEVAVETTIRYGGEPVARETTHQELAPGATRLAAHLELTDPRLWWPNGHGEQPLYEAEVRVFDRGVERESARRSVSFGVREVELVANDTPDPTARPYTLRVNRRKIYIKGWNWVPLDVLYGVPRPEKLERLLMLARRANVNVLRVWGGGLIEKEAFYELCDRYGIMVWQEFIQSSSGIDNKPSEDAGFVEMLVQEAQQIIPRRMNHPSLVIWCGGNELTDQERVPLDDSEPVLGALRSVVERLDPDRAWLPTSPSGRAFGNSLADIQKDPLSLHDVHGPWEHQGLVGQYALYNAGTSLLHSEFGVEGITSLRSLKASLSPERHWPVSRDNPYWFHTSSWWIKERVLHEAYGTIEDLPTLVRASQFLQAEGLRYAVEANRRRKYRNSGTLPWQFNEPYPNAACTSAVDYFAVPKPAYYGVARAYEPVHVSASFPAQVWEGTNLFASEIWVSNSHDHGVSDAVLEARLVGAGGTVYEERRELISFGANRAVMLASIECPLAQVQEDLFFLDLRLLDPSAPSAEAISSNRYLFSRTASLSPMMQLPDTTVQVDTEKVGERWRIGVTNAGSCAALPLWLEDARPVEAQGYAYFSDNHFSLLPRERRIITVKWAGVEPSERRLELSGWNAGIHAIE